VTAPGFRLGALIVACFLLGLMIVAVYRLRWLFKPSKLPLQREEQLRLPEAREAFRKRLGLRTLTYADLEWEVAELNRERIQIPES
jgi:hypothetical protein